MKVFVNAQIFVGGPMQSSWDRSSMAAGRKRGRILNNNPHPEYIQRLYRFIIAFTPRCIPPTADGAMAANNSSRAAAQDKGKKKSHTVHNKSGHRIK